MIFLQTGCYSMELPQNIIALSINSLQFSKYNLETNDENAPKLIFDWLNMKFNYAKRMNKRVILVYHLPHEAISTPIGIERFWKEKI